MIPRAPPAGERSRSRRWSRPTPRRTCRRGVDGAPGGGGLGSGFTGGLLPVAESHLAGAGRPAGHRLAAAPAAEARRTRRQRDRPPDGRAARAGRRSCWARWPAWRRRRCQPTYAHNPFLFNRTTTATDVRITWVLRKVDCNTTPDVLGAMLGPSDLDDPRALTLHDRRCGRARRRPGRRGCRPSASARRARPVRLQLRLRVGPDTECVAAILETPGATPVLMVTPRQWDAPASGDFVSCCDSSNPNSRCSPKLDTGRNPGDEALSITNSGGTLRFDLTHGGPHEEGPVSDTPDPDRAHRSGGDRGAPARRRRLPRVARQIPRAGRHRDGMHRRRRLSVAAGADAAGRRPDVRGVREPQACPRRPSNPSRRSSTACARPPPVTATAPLAGGLPRGPLRRAVRRRQPAALPRSACSSYSSYPDGICDLYSGSCLGNDGFICTCRDQKYACAPDAAGRPDLPAGVSARTINRRRRPSMAARLDASGAVSAMVASTEQERTARARPTAAARPTRSATAARVSV